VRSVETCSMRAMNAAACALALTGRSIANTASAGGTGPFWAS
jgi:hypothetical protein